MRTIMLAMLTALILTAPAAAQQCLSVVPVPCGDGAAYETKWDTGGLTVSTSSGPIAVTRMRRLVLPTVAAEPAHLAVLEATDMPAPMTVAVDADTIIGGRAVRVTGTLGRGRFVVVEATKAIAPAVPPDATDGRVLLCYGLATVQVVDATTGDRVTGRQAVGFHDQFGPHDGTVGRPVYACVPGTAATTEAFVAWGNPEGFGAAGQSVVVDTPLAAPFGPLLLTPMDEFWTAAVLR